MSKSKITEHFNTLAFEVSIGYISGYDNLESKQNIETLDENLFVKLWQEEAKKVYEVNGIYVSVIGSKSKAIYNEDWGCPPNGEDVYTFKGIMNKTFIEDRIEYKQSVIEIVLNISKRLNQKTVTITFFDDVICDYIENNYEA